MIVILSVCLSVCLTVCLSVCLSASLPLCIYVFEWLSVCVTVCVCLLALGNERVCINLSNKPSDAVWQALAKDDLDFVIVPVETLSRWEPSLNVVLLSALVQGASHVVAQRVPPVKSFASQVDG